MPQELVDLIRISHLFCFALGMGSGLFFDFRALWRINTAFSAQDVTEIESVHRFVTMALIGLWLSGLALIYIRTGFVLSEFSPKLYAKLIVVTLLTANAFLIGALILPTVTAHTGRKAIDLPAGSYFASTLCASASLACWVVGLTLGASATLKTADWDSLGLLLGSAFGLIILGSLILMSALRLILRHTNLTNHMSDALTRYDPDERITTDLR